jgi:predicted amidohydrolase
MVLPELAPTGYGFADRAEAWAAAETIDGPSVATVRALSGELSVTVVFGIALQEGTALYNAAVLLEDGELLGVYRKSHLWAREKLIFNPGDDGPFVVRTRCGSVALLVCYDLEFPELVRMSAQAGAEIVAAPANWPVIDHPADQIAIEVVKAQAAAASYGVYVVVADRCGDERGARWVGGSCIIAPTGYLLEGPATRPGEQARERLLLADIDPVVSRNKALGDHNDRLLDRRESLYYLTPDRRHADQPESVRPAIP